jgi:hypothetical protein
MKSKSSLSGRVFSLNDGANGSASFSLAPSGGFPSSSSGNIRAGSYALTATSVTETHINFSNIITLTGQVTFTKKPVTVSISASDKVYDRLVSASSSASMSGIVSGDTVTLNTPSATFSDKDAGNGKIVTMSGISISGTDVANYDLQNFTATATANITPKPITSSYTASDKIYDRSTSATVNGSLAGVIFGDTVTVAKTSSIFSDINVGNSKTVTVSGISIGGPGASNYSLQNSLTTTTANITPKTVTASYTSDSKTYDRNNIASVSGSLSGIISGDQVSLSNVSALFSDMNVANGKTVTVSGISIDGSSSSNYSLQNSNATTNANILHKVLTASFSASDKIYDRNTIAAVTSSLSGIILGDTVSLAEIIANFSNKKAANNKTVTVSSTITGADSSNYSLSNSTDYILASIAKKPLNASFSATNKVYDGTSKVEVEGSSSDVISGDEVIFEYEKAKFIDDTIGTEKQVLVSGIFLSGPDAENYKLQNTSYVTSATVAAPADIAGSVYYIDWSTPEFFKGDVVCNGCIDWKRLYKMLKIEDNIKSIINYVNLSDQEDENKSASKEKLNNDLEKDLNQSVSILRKIMKILL